MLDGSIVKPIMQLAYRLVLELGAFLWWIDRSILLVGYYVLALTDWLTQSAFSPLLTGVATMTSGIAANMFVLAMMVLAFTYLLAVFFRLNVVDPKSAFLWMLFATLIFQIGPEAYLGLEKLRRGFGGAMYDEGINALSGGGTGLSMIGSTTDNNIDPATNQFGTFVASDVGVDGLDMAMAYLMADAYDVLTPPISPHGVGRVPYKMMEWGGCVTFPDCNTFFDPRYSASEFGSLNQEERQQAIGLAFQGVLRLGTGIILALFGLIEQVIYFVLAIAFGLAFVSLFIAIIFAFFKHTEPIAWSVFNLILELFMQSIITSLMLSLVMGFVLIGAQTGNGVVLLGAGFVGMILSFGLFVSALKSVLNSGSRLFQSFGQITGGSIVSTGTMAGYAGSLASGAATAAGGGTAGQVAGATFGNSKLAQQAYYASRSLGEDSMLGGFADSFAEGAAAKQFGGPVGGYMLGAGEKQSSQQSDNRNRSAHTPRAFDSEADDAIAAYRDDPINNYHRLEQSFGSNARQVAQLSDSYSDDEFDEVVDAVRTTRNSRPTENPESPRFDGQVRAEVQQRMTPEQMATSPLGDMPPNDLAAFSSAFAYRTAGDDPIKRRADVSAGREEAVTDRTQELAEQNPDTDPADLRERASGQVDYETRTARELERGDQQQPYQQAFHDYKTGATDRESEQALDAFQGDTAGLAAIFDSINEDDFAAVSNAVQTMEFINPQAVQSPEFIGDVEQRLGQGHPLYGNQAALGTVIGAVTGENNEQSTATENDDTGAPESVPPPNWDHILAAGPPPDGDWHPLDRTNDQIPVFAAGSDQQTADDSHHETNAAATTTAQPAQIDQDDFTADDAQQLAHLNDSHQEDNFAALTSTGQTTIHDNDNSPQFSSPTIDQDDFTADDARQLAHLNDSHQEDDFAQVGTQLSAGINAAMGNIRFTGAIPTTAGAAALVSGNLGQTGLAGQQQLQQDTGQFIVQAAQTGLSGQQAQQVLGQVAQTGQLSPQTQQAVSQSFQQAHPDASAADGQQAASALERAALALSQSANNMQSGGISEQASGSNTVAPPSTQSGGSGTSNAPVASPRSPNAGGGSPVSFDFDQGGD